MSCNCQLLVLLRHPHLQWLVTLPGSALLLSQGHGGMFSSLFYITLFLLFSEVCLLPVVPTTGGFPEFPRRAQV